MRYALAIAACVLVFSAAEARAQTAVYCKQPLGTMTLFPNDSHTDVEVKEVQAINRQSKCFTAMARTADTDYVISLGKRGRERSITVTDRNQRAKTYRATDYYFHAYREMVRDIQAHPPKTGRTAGSMSKQRSQCFVPMALVTPGKRLFDDKAAYNEIKTINRTGNCLVWYEATPGVHPGLINIEPAPKAVGLGLLAKMRPAIHLSYTEPSDFGAKKWVFDGASYYEAYGAMARWMLDYYSPENIDKHRPGWYRDPSTR